MLYLGGFVSLSITISEDNLMGYMYFIDDYYY
jgi:hypothetical protein